MAESLLCLHATDPATVFLAVLARCPEATLDEMAAALYDRGELVRMLGMRRTMFVVPRDLAATVHHAAALDVAATMRRRLLTQLATLPTEPALPDELAPWLGRVEDAVVAAVAARGQATGAQLSTDVPELRTAILPTTDKAYDVRRNITTQVLTILGAQGRIARGQPRGAWGSRHHTWVPAVEVFRDGLGGDVGAARSELVRRWLARFGPATFTDVQWWTGWGKGVTQQALAGVATREVRLDGEPGLALADDALADPPSPPGAVLLPALDSSPMGWKRREWMFDCDQEPLFDRNGNIGPTVWWDGAIVGGWAFRPDGRIVWRLLAERGAEAEAGVARAAESLQARLGGATITPSFPTPLERELRTG